jgi:hypothetical protein
MASNSPQRSRRSSRTTDQGNADATTVPRAHGDAEELGTGALTEQTAEPQIAELGIGNPPEFPAAGRGFSPCCVVRRIDVNIYYVK